MSQNTHYERPQSLPHLHIFADNRGHLSALVIFNSIQVKPNWHPLKNLCCARNTCAIVFLGMFRSTQLLPMEIYRCFLVPRHTQSSASEGLDTLLTSHFNALSQKNDAFIQWG
jgi:hypothetical protein